MPQAKKDLRGRGSDVPKAPAAARGGHAARPSALLDTRVIYCGDNLDQLAKLPGGCIDLIYIDPPFNSNRDDGVLWGETREQRAIEERHASTQADIDYMRVRSVGPARVLKETGGFHYHCDRHASRYDRVWVRPGHTIGCWKGAGGGAVKCANDSGKSRSD
jgi:hypothetical protein